MLGAVAGYGVLGNSGGAGGKDENEYDGACLARLIVSGGAIDAIASSLARFAGGFEMQCTGARCLLRVLSAGTFGRDYSKCTNGATGTQRRRFSCPSFFQQALERLQRAQGVAAVAQALQRFRSHSQAPKLLKAGKELLDLVRTRCAQVGYAAWGRAPHAETRLILGDFTSFSLTSSSH